MTQIEIESFEVASVIDPVAQYRAKDDLFTPSNIISAIRAFMVLPSNYPGKIAVVAIALSLFLALLSVPNTIIFYTEILALVLMTVSLVAYGTRLKSLLAQM